MATLTKQTVQRLAVLRSLSMWKNGAFGPVRVHKTLFFADRDTTDDEWHLFTFKRWFLGQYSDDIAESMNGLKDAGRISTYYDGPSERIVADLPAELETAVQRFFRSYFPEWESNLQPAFRKWGYLTNDQIITKAHDDPTYKRTKHGEVVLRSFSEKQIEFVGLNNDMAETLSDLVNDKLQRGLAARIKNVADNKIVDEDWREIYFGEGRQRTKSA